jgi:hypothetical protein
MGTVTVSMRASLRCGLFALTVLVLSRNKDPQCC